MSLQKWLSQSVVVVATLAMLAAQSAQSLTCSARSLEQPNLVVTASFSDKSVKPSEPIQLTLSRLLVAPERIGVLIGNTDVSSLFVLDKTKLRYRGDVWPLPTGESQVVVYLVAANEWTEIARFALRVSEEQSDVDQTRFRFEGRKGFDFMAGRNVGGPFALEESPDEENDNIQDQQRSPKPRTRRVKFTPSLTLTVNSQPAQSTFPDPQPERATFTDLNLQASLRNESTYHILQTQSSFDFAGSTFQQAALRFATLGNDAPNIDLASYLVQFQTGRVKYEVGHFSYGSQRQLINSFSSRGITIQVPFLKRFDVSVAAMNGTQLVGFENFFGVQKRRHQMLSGTLGIELMPKRPGALRFEAALLSAYFQPISGFNRGVITDTQRSRGVAVRLIASDKKGRLHLDTGFTRSFFVSPNDPTLSQNFGLVPLPALSRNAHYIDASYEIFRGFSLTKTKKANLTVAFREENIAPLFRSLGASTQADKVQYEISATGSINEINVQFGHVNFHDNLRRIPSILRSLNGNTHLSLGAPAGAIFNLSKPPVWLPRLAFSFDRVHAFGAAIPVNGGFEFNLSAIPDLVGTSQTFSADWLVRNFTIGYNLNHSYQNNQQVGRERADQGVLVNTGRFGIPLNKKMSFNVDLSEESSANKETGRIDRTFRLGPGVSWQLSKHMGVTANLSNTISGDAANTSHGRNTEFDAAWTYRFEKGKEGPRKIAGQFFIRYANHYSRLIDRVFFADTLRKNQTLTANFGITFF